MVSGLLRSTPRGVPLVESADERRERKNERLSGVCSAKELNLETKALLEYAKELGLEGITNQLSGLSPEQAESLKELCQTRAENRLRCSAATPHSFPARLPKTGRSVPQRNSVNRVQTIKTPAEARPPCRPVESQRAAPAVNSSGCTVPAVASADSRPKSTR